MVAIKNLFLLISTVSALSIASRQSVSVDEDISDINSQIQSIIASLNAYTGGLEAATPLQTAESEIERSIQQGTYRAQNSAQFSSADTRYTLTQVHKSVVPNIHAALEAVVAKKALFAALNVTEVVQTDLTNLRSEIDIFGKALVLVASSDYTAESQATLDTIECYFDDAILAYAT